MLSNSSVSWLGASFAFQFKAKSLFAVIALCYVWQPPALNCVSTTVLTFHPGFIVPGKDGFFFCNHNESDAGCIDKLWLSVRGDRKHWTKCYGNFMLGLIWQPSKGCAFWFISRCCRKCVFSYFMCWWHAKLWPSELRPQGSLVEAGQSVGPCPLNLILLISPTEPGLVKLQFMLLEGHCHYSLWNAAISSDDLL